MSESFYFALRVLSLRVEHSFAKTIKSGTTYRLALFKGVQKCDEMKDAVTSKIVGGKIDLSLPILQFNVPYYSPNRNIEFHLKLYEAKPYQQQNQIATYKLKSSDIIKTFKNDKNVLQKGQGQFQTDLFLQYELFIQNSKEGLKQAIQKFSSNQTYKPKSIKNIQSQNKSQSSRSKQVVREGDGFISPRRRIQRKRGNQSKLRSRENSRDKARDKSDDEGSVTSSRRKFKKSPPTQKQQHFLHNNKKASPPKVEKSDTKAKSTVSKSPGKQSQTKSNIQSSVQTNQKTYSYQAPNKLKYKSTAQIFDVQIQKQQKPVGLKPSYSKPNLQIKTQIEEKKPSVYSPKSIPETKVTPIIKKLAQQKVSLIAKNQPAEQRKISPGKYNPVRSPKSGIVLKPEEGGKDATNLVVASKNPTSSKITDLQFQHTKQIFDINSKKSGVNISKEGEKNTLNITKNQNKLQQSDVRITMDGPNAQPELNKKIPQIVSESNEQDEPIKVKQKAVKRKKSQIQMEPTLKGSVRLNEFTHKFDQERRKKEQQEYKKYRIYYAGFLIIGLFFIYLAMTPSRKV